MQNGKHEIKCNFLRIWFCIQFLLTGKISPDAHVASGKGKSVIYIYIFILPPTKLHCSKDRIIQDTICDNRQLLVFHFAGI